jgi:hypothetical protein
MAEHPEPRAADSDRERVAADLREHFASGRLAEEEFSEQLETVYASRTMAELERGGPIFRTRARCRCPLVRASWRAGGSTRTPARS